jgi:hypothetical protein
MDKIICKKIKNEIECKENKECIFTKTKKCQQKRQSKKIDKTLKSATKSSIISAKLISNSKASSESQKIPSYIKPDSLENNPCLGLETIKQQIKETRRLYDENIQACENYHHQEFITKYFNKQTSTHKDLLICLMKYYKEEKNKNALYVFTFQDFIAELGRFLPWKRSSSRGSFFFVRPLQRMSARRNGRCLFATISTLFCCIRTP